MPKLGTSNFIPSWGEVNISQALAASKQQVLCLQKRENTKKEQKNLSNERFLSLRSTMNVV